jgi:hypothetical protein
MSRKLIWLSDETLIPDCAALHPGYNPAHKRFGNQYS